MRLRMSIDKMICLVIMTMIWWVLMTPQSLSSHLSPQLIAVKQESTSEFHSQKMTVRYKWPKVTPFNSCQLSYQNITTAHKYFLWNELVLWRISQSKSQTVLAVPWDNELFLVWRWLFFNSFKNVLPIQKIAVNLPMMPIFIPFLSVSVCLFIFSRFYQQHRQMLSIWVSEC